MCCRTRDREDSKNRGQHRLTHRESWSKRRSRSRCGRYASEDSEDRSRSTTWSAHSIEQNSFQDHPELYGRHSSNVHERLPNDLHGQYPFECNDFVKKTFHTISKSKLMASIKLPHWNGINNMRVKVDNGAEANILPLGSFRTMFPHALDEYSYPEDRFLEDHGQTLNVMITESW